MEAWRPGGGLWLLSGREVTSGLDQGGSSEMVRMVVRMYFQCRSNRICSVGFVDGLGGRSERKRSQGKLQDFSV